MNKIAQLLWIYSVWDYFSTRWDHNYMYNRHKRGEHILPFSYRVILSVFSCFYVPQSVEYYGVARMYPLCIGCPFVNTQSWGLSPIYSWCDQKIVRFDGPSTPNGLSGPAHCLGHTHTIPYHTIPPTRVERVDGLYNLIRFGGDLSRFEYIQCE